MTISDLIKEAEQKYLLSLKNIFIDSIKRDADLLRERDLLVKEIEKISPLENVIETYDQLKEKNKDDIDVVRFVEKKKKIPKGIKETYEVAKNKIKNYETLDSSIKKMPELGIQGVISLDDSLVLILPIYAEDKIPRQRNLSYDLYSQVSVWFNENVQKLKDSNLTLDDISSDEKEGMVSLIAKPNKETEKAKKVLKNLKELLFDGLNELDLIRLNKANIRFSLYDDEEGYIYKSDISKKRNYTPQEIYDKYKINAANLAWLVRRGIIKPELRENVRYYDADKIDEVLSKKQGYTIKEAARMWKELQQRFTKKDISSIDYEARISDLKGRNRINIIESKNIYLVPVKEFDNHLYRMSLLYKIDSKKRELKKGIEPEYLQKLLKLDDKSIDVLVSDGILRLNKKGKYEVPSVRKFIYIHRFSGDSWTPYK